MKKVDNNESKKKAEIIGWTPISEYSRDKYDWVLVKYFDGSYECVPEVAEMRVDGKWYSRSGALIPDIFDVKYFFDMQQLDKKGGTKTIDDLTDDFLKDVIKTLDKAAERLLHPYGITRDNMHDFKDRVELIIDRNFEYTRRVYFLDGKYIGTVRFHVDTDFEDLHAEFVAEIIYEDKERWQQEYDNELAKKCV